tara:strand:- start:422 stop:529 length:108 start_codon:yes stop_codon:yes gene_type:complete
MLMLIASGEKEGYLWKQSGSMQLEEVDREMSSLGR